MIAEILAPNGSKISCLYYEIEEKCKEICKEYCSLSLDNLKEFENFSKDYTYFAPYFDFVFGNLEYSLLHFGLNETIMLTGIKKERVYVLKQYSSYFDKYVTLDFGAKFLHFSSDKDLKIEPFIPERSLEPCFITHDLYKLVPSIGGHRALAYQLLNLGMIRDKELCEKMFSLKQDQSEMGEILMFLWPLLRFDIYDYLKKQCMVVYHSKNCTQEQLDLISSLMQMGYLSQLNLFDYYPKHDKEVLNWSYKFKRKEDELDANRRF